jgi:hypothetical protein
MVYDETKRESKRKGVIMKKMIVFAFVLSLFSTVAVADIYHTSLNTCNEHEMRAALDRATMDKRAVITIVECDNGVVRTVSKPEPKFAKPVVNTCGCGCGEKQEVVKREYFVRETVQTYKPVVKYVPSGTYTRVKPACNHGCF